jgi:hypothetical protein
MFISAADDSPMPDPESLRAALAREFGEDRVALVEPAGPGVAEFRVAVTPHDDTPFQVSLLRGGSLAMDGTTGQSVVVAAVVAGVLPAGHGRVVVVEPGADRYVDLVPGITAGEITGRWRPISEGGF